MASTGFKPYPRTWKQVPESHAEMLKTLKELYAQLHDARLRPE